MTVLTKQEILESLKDDRDNSLFIDPLLDKSQIGAISVDLRLGCDFLVSIFTRKPFIEVNEIDSEDYRGIATHYQMTRRDLGDNFVLFPNQSVLTTTLEYVSIPNDMYLDVLTRSSYSRLGIQLNTMIQPGFRGCLPVELFNHGNNPVQLVVGSRVFQARVSRIEDSQHYLSSDGYRKYYGHTKPVASRANKDKDLETLYKFRNK